MIPTNASEREGSVTAGVRDIATLVIKVPADGGGLRDNEYR